MLDSILTSPVLLTWIVPRWKEIVWQALILPGRLTMSALCLLSTTCLPTSSSGGSSVPRLPPLSPTSTSTDKQRPLPGGRPSTPLPLEQLLLVVLHPLNDPASIGLRPQTALLRVSLVEHALVPPARYLVHTRDVHDPIS